MVATLSFNPFQTTVASGSFNVATTGYVAGTLLDNPAEIMKIAQGIVAQTETYPMWGGIGISEYIPNPAGIVTPSGFGASPDTTIALGPNLVRATSIGTNPITAAAPVLTGFTVFNQSQALVNTPQSPVPAAGSGGSINFVRIGSGVRLAVQCNPVLASLQGDPINFAVSWDFGSQELVPYVAAYAQNTLTSLTWASTGGGSVTGTTTTAHGLLPGQAFTLAGNVPAAYNGEFVATAGTAGSVLHFLLPAASTPGTVTTLGYLVGGGGQLLVETIAFSIGNCMVPVFNPATGLTTWNRSGSCAVIIV
jgi:hypothetical protein